SPWSHAVVVFVAFLAASASLTIIYFLLLRPLDKINVAMREVAKGDFSVRLDTESRIREIQNLYTDFNIMAKELGATEIIQNDFVSNVSHEFKTPINAIQGYATLLQQMNPENETDAEYVRKILLNTTRLSDLVGNILLLSKLDNSSLELSESEYRLDEQIRLSIVLLEERWSAKEIDLDVDLDEIVYRGSEKLLAHVFSNLIGNAVKFSPQRGAVRVLLRKGNGGDIIFSVSDDGPGIPEHAMEHIFDRFYQTDSSHKAEGNGLGLALVKQILTVIGGTVDVTNNSDGPGCTFRVLLPNR
ncbi:MAG: HAMP domain-containing histidine kinase, partial [Lachnospiraceae bacterium]|nr:HAMP domain-containing histidine kinase [Lachnospiraceae bacterium]